MANSSDIKTVAVFAAQRKTNCPEFNKQAQNLGRYLAQEGYTILFGGLFGGLMEDCTRAALKEGGHVKGYLPQIFAHFANDEIVEGNYKRIITPTVDPSRKAMISESDAMIALPGGWGTFGEIGPAAEGQYTLFYDDVTAYLKPVILFNIAGHYNGIKTWRNRAIKDGTISPEHKDVVQFADDLNTIKTILKTPRQQPKAIAP